MNEEKNPDVTKSGFSLGLGSLFASLPKGTRWAIGGVLFYFLFTGGVMAIVRLSESKCWELQFKNDRVFRFNVCDGTAIELDKTTMEPKKVK
jgi:hypothetical protein